jgi:hypothetical protein
VACGSSDDVDCAARGACEDTPARMAVFLHVADNPLAAGAPPDLPSDGSHDSARLFGNEDTLFFGIVAPAARSRPQRRTHGWRQDAPRPGVPYRLRLARGHPLDDWRKRVSGSAAPLEGLRAWRGALVYDTSLRLDAHQHRSRFADRPTENTAPPGLG